ncbi:MAG TPA: N-acetylmuramoyl-L-alanine amidase [Saprospiraceae bacterium]|nr:N-acetylmuramoyl-L-alanine amidase [Saprospiraceae bacterium]HMP25562.1 N-acetylmuramoyl-L-alanine amidase [Saprospiraceae bacterium]
MRDLCIFLDAGHGGVDKNGNYTTAPSKQFQHTQGTFHNGRWFYEGVFNRIITDIVAHKLRNLGISYLIVSHDYVDTPLAQRVDMANWYHRNYKPGIFISNHANASNGRARGYEIYTSPGKTPSDDIADLHWKNVRDLLGNRITMRSDLSDGHYDKEAGFFVLTRTAMPAILIEHLFFDNYDDAMLLMDDNVVDLFAEATIRTVIQWLSR